MAQLWKVEFEGMNTAVVASNWLEEMGGESLCYWPPYDVQRVDRAELNHIPLGLVHT